MAGIGRVLRNFDGDVLFPFSKFISIQDSNEVEIVVILEVLKFYVGFFQEPLIIESDSNNAISKASSVIGCPWKFHFYLNKSILYLFLQRWSSGMFFVKLMKWLMG